MQIKENLIDGCKEVPLWAWKMNECEACKQARSARTHSQKWQNGSRQGGKYVLKGERKTFVGWGTYFILLNQFVRFFSEPRYQKSRVFPCKLPSLISLSDMLHCTTTHQRPSMRWAKGSKPRWEQSLCTPEHRGLPHSLSCQTVGRKRRNTSQKISTGSVIYDDLCRAPRLKHYESSSLIPFFLFIFSLRVSFHFLPVFCLCTFLSRSLCTCTSSATPRRCRPAIFFCLLSRPRTHISENSCLPAIVTSGNETLRFHTKQFVKSKCRGPQS